MTDDIPTCVAVLEQIAKENKEGLGRLERQQEAMRVEIRQEMKEGFALLRDEIHAIREDRRQDSRWGLNILFSAMGGAVMLIAALAAPLIPRVLGVR